MQGKKECRGLKSVCLPVRMELIFADLGITCLLLQFFFLFRFDNILTSWQTWPYGGSEVLRCSLWNYSGVAFSWCFKQLSLPCKYTEASCQRFECSASTVTLKQWLSMFDIYWALMGEEFTVGLIFLLAFYLFSSSLVEWRRIFAGVVHNLGTTDQSLNFGATFTSFDSQGFWGSATWMLLALQYLPPFLPSVPMRMNRNPCQLSHSLMLCYFSSRR